MGFFWFVCSRPEKDVEIIKVQDGKSLTEIVSYFAEQIDEAYPNCGWGECREKLSLKLDWVKDLNGCGVDSNRTAN